MTLPLAGRRIVYVGGKGGVGKTTVAASVALRFADEGQRVLVVSTDPAHSLGDVFQQAIGSQPRALAPNLRGLELDPDARLDEYLADVKKSMKQLVHPDMYGEVDRQVELARSSPGAEEAAMLERMSELMVADEADYDVLVFDTAPTGQTLRLLSLPEIMAAWTDGLLRHRERSDHMAGVIGRMTPQRSGGDDLSHFQEHSEAEAGDDRFGQIRTTLLRRRRLFHRARRLLLEPETTAFVLVLIPERLPVLETAKAVEALNHFQVPIAGLVVNRILPSGPLGPFLEERRVQERQYLDQIRDRFSALPRVEVPLFAKDVGGLEALRAVAAHVFPSR
ncbi:MAG: ArsA family ATPase [Gemmatimonadales bacterium]